MDAENAEVLVVEDDELVRSYLRRAVESAGMNCVSTASAAEALETLDKSKAAPLAVLIDGLLPDMHGSELARQILDDPRWIDVGICFVSGALRDTPTFTAGIDALVKPVHRDDLVACLDRIQEWRQAGGSEYPERSAVLTLITERFMIAP